MINILKAFDTEHIVCAQLDITFWVGIMMPGLWMMVTLRYCELSVTEFSVCVFVFIFLLYCLPYAGPTHMP